MVPGTYVFLVGEGYRHEEAVMRAFMSVSLASTVASYSRNHAQPVQFPPPPLLGPAVEDPVAEIPPTGLFDVE